jgi:hypothetical protein
VALRTLRLIIAATVAELVAVLVMMLPGIAVFATLSATVTERMLSMQRLAVWTALAGGFLFCLLGAMWVLRGASAGHERNGLALGIAVALIDLALLIASGAPFGALMIASVAGRIAGGYCGGLLTKRRALRLAEVR